MKRVVACGVVLVLLLAGSRAGAQSTTNVPVVDPIEQLSFDRPESWALKYFTSAMLLSGLETPVTRQPGSVSVGVEIGWLPSLSVEQRTVGFDGTKTEDLNKAPVLPRPRVLVGLPGRFSLIVGIVPPVRVFGVKSKLFAFGVERPIHESDSLALGLRGYGQLGNVEAAFTCPASVVPLALDSPGNPYGCQAESSDTATLQFVGGEFGAGYRGTRLHGLTPHASASVNYYDLAFQVNALRDNFLDRTYQTSHGVTFAMSGGVGYPLSKRLSAAFDVFYAPLGVARRTGLAAQNDGLFNVRALVAYRLR